MDLKSRVENFTNNDSASFHSLIKDLVMPLNFHPNGYRFEAIDTSGIAKTFSSRDDLVQGCISEPKEYAIINKFINSNSFIISASYHKSLEDLDSNTFFDYRLMTNSLFSLNNCIIPIEGLRKRFPSFDPFEMAFKSNYLIQKDNLYFLHPKYLLEVVD